MVAEMSVLEAVRTFVGLAVPSTGAAEILRPVADHDELAEYRLRKQVDEARQELRDARARRLDADHALAIAHEPLERALAAVATVDPAIERARVAREADRQARRVALETGAAHDFALARAAEDALRDVREARRAHVAANDVLPALRARVAEAERAVRLAQERIEDSISKVMAATLADRVKDVHALAGRLNEIYIELASLSELFLRGRNFGVAPGHIPEETVPRVQAQFTSAELLEGIQPWLNYARRLREDPGAAFE